jgi:hypothetical protein
VGGGTDETVTQDIHGGRKHQGLLRVLQCAYVLKERSLTSTTAEEWHFFFFWAELRFEVGTHARASC